jgi:hypothetical protein
MIGTKLLVFIHLLTVDAYFKCSSDADCNYVGCVCSSSQNPANVGGWSVCPCNGIDNCNGYLCNGPLASGESYCSIWYQVYTTNVNECFLVSTETANWCPDPPACPLGLYSSDGYDRVVNPCKSCPAGSFSSSWGASFCTLCDAGLFSAIPGATTCTTCSTGSYYEGTGSSPWPAFISVFHVSSCPCLTQVL